MSQCTYSDNIASIGLVLLRMYGNNVSFVDMINEDSYDDEILWLNHTSSVHLVRIRM